MGTLNWVGGSGSQSWATAANWDTAAVPVTGDDVYIAQGNSDINSGLAQSGVTLNSLNILPGFSGTIGSTGNSGDSLAIGATNVYVNSQSGRTKLDFGSVTHTTTVVSTGGSSDTNLEAFRIRGGTNTSKLYVVGNNQTAVGVATTRAGITATLSEWDVRGGTVNLGAGLTCATGKQSGGTVTLGGSATTITQTGSGTLIHQGSGTITTLTATGTVIENSRPAAGTDVIGTLTTGPGATVDFSQNPAPCTLTNAPILGKGTNFLAFMPNQVALHAASLTIKGQQCGLSDLTINVGSQVQATITNW